MAHDRRTGRDVALKVMRAGDVAENEYEVQTQLRRVVRDPAGLVVYQQTFFLNGNLGQKHRVLVLPLVGPSLNAVLRRRPMAARRFAARQLLQSLAKVHIAGIVMNGKSAPRRRIDAHRRIRSE
jgi:hypothetical protein